MYALIDISNQKFGFVSAGQGRKYSLPLHRLQVGAKIYAYMAGLGFVGFGEVTKPAQMIRDFVVSETTTPFLSAGLKAERPYENSDDEELSEWVVGVNRLKRFRKLRQKRSLGFLQTKISFASYHKSRH